MAASRLPKRRRHRHPDQPRRLHNPAAALPATGKRPCPKALAEQAQAVRAQLAALGTAATPAAIASAFKGTGADRVSDLLETLASLGHARTLPDGTLVAQ